MEKSNALQIDIVGNRYFVDPTQENLIPVDKELSIIHIGDLDIAMDHEWERSGYYDLINKCLYHPPENLKELPEQVTGFSIPSYQELLEAQRTTLVVYAETAALKDTALAVTVAENKIESATTQAADLPDKSRPASKDEMAGVEVDDEVYFLVDFVKLHLREHANPDNIIPLARMKDTGTDYEFMYDPKTRNIASSPSPRQFKIEVPHLTKLHPEAVARIYKVPVEEVKKRNDKEFFRDLGQISGAGTKHQRKAKKKRGKGL